MSGSDRTRVVLVTGANRGLGLGCARYLERHGHQVVGTWRTEPTGERPEVRCDVTDEDSVEAAVDEVEARHGPIGALVSNAGWAHRDLSIRSPAAKFREVVDANLTGAFLVGRCVARAMIKRREGSLVFVSSVSALYGTPGVASYTSSKAGLIGLARTMARELGSRHIRANVVAPGLLENWSDITPAAPDWIAHTPLRRAGTLDEVAAVVEFLCTDRSSFLTGAVIPVDGGFAMGL